MDDKELILNVKEQDALYDNNATDYYNLLMRDNIWEKIGAKMGVAGKRCKARWGYLRDLYMKSRKTRRLKLAHGNFTSKPWKYEAEMEFLNPFLGLTKTNQFIRNRNLGMHRRTSSPLPEEITQDIDPENTSSSPLPLDTAASPPLSLNHASASHSPIQNSRYTFRKSETANAAMYMHNFSNRQALSCDALMKYFEAVAETVRGFSPMLQVKVKSEISKIVHQAEMEHIQQMEFEPCLQSEQDLTQMQFSSNNTGHLQYSFDSCMKQEQPG
ncbi:uncharacterized protein LOC128880345 [Hylaeus volcanicus]|uniref:uncharacterized protein LOC128880345 n=1 Tax=Hylaeus volcanicus TaxID=313075 RepID=UPI0023B78F94|nr:uncharacterized protein LOC128880345 [Hylaeus volcanicus]